MSFPPTQELSSANGTQDSHIIMGLYIVSVSQWDAHPWPGLEDVLWVTREGDHAGSVVQGKL